MTKCNKIPLISASKEELLDALGWTWRCVAWTRLANLNQMQISIDLSHESRFHGPCVRGMAKPARLFAEQPTHKDTPMAKKKSPQQLAAEARADRLIAERRAAAANELLELRQTLVTTRRLANGDELADQIADKIEQLVETSDPHSEAAAGFWLHTTLHHTPDKPVDTVENVVARD